MAEGEWVKLVSPIGSKSAVWENFGMPVYESNGVRRQDKEHVICKLCDAALKYTGSCSATEKIAVLVLFRCCSSLHMSHLCFG